MLKPTSSARKLAAFLFLSLPLAGFASEGGEGSKGGGGGDTKTETRIDDIREDLLKWISEGGAKKLNLPDGLTYSVYETTMMELLSPRRVVVSAILKNEEVDTDEELNTKVLGQPKTCKGFFSKKDFLPHILCNIERFSGLSDAEQYRQVHHEYAGLGGLEKNVGAASDYSISKQISDYLTLTKVWKLAVKVKSRFDGCRIAIHVAHVGVERREKHLVKKAVRKAGGKIVRDSEEADVLFRLVSIQSPAAGGMRDNFLGIEANGDTVRIQHPGYNPNAPLRPSAVNNAVSKILEQLPCSSR